MSRGIHQLSGIYPDADTAYRASLRLSESGLPEERIHLFKPDDPDLMNRVRRLRNPIGFFPAGDTVLGAVAGGMSGLIFLLIAVGKAPSADIFVMAIIIFMIGAASGAAAGAVIGLKLDDSQSLDMIVDAVRHGHWAIVVDARGEEDTSVSRILTFPSTQASTRALSFSEANQHRQRTGG